MNLKQIYTVSFITYHLNEFCWIRCVYKNFFKKKKKKEEKRGKEEKDKQKDKTSTC